MTIAIDHVDHDVTQDLLTVTLTDGTVVTHWYYTGEQTTSVDTKFRQVDPDPLNQTGDKHSRTVRGFAWNRRGGRQNIDEVTTFTHVIDHPR